MLAVVWLCPNVLVVVVLLFVLASPLASAPSSATRFHCTSRSASPLPLSAAMSAAANTTPMETTGSAASAAAAAPSNTAGATAASSSAASANPAAAAASSTGGGSEKKEIYTYEAPWLIYGMNWSVRPDQRFRVALGSFVEDYNNKVEVVQLNEDSGKFQSKGTFIHPYPTTKIMWCPDKVGSREDLLATTGDYLRLWKMPPETGSGAGEPIKMQSLLNNNKNSEFCAPLTSFDWNETDPSMVGTSSIDTTSVLTPQACALRFAAARHSAHTPSFSSLLLCALILPPVARFGTWRQDRRRRN